MPGGGIVRSQCSARQYADVGQLPLHPEVGARGRDGALALTRLERQQRRFTVMQGVAARRFEVQSLCR